MTALAKIQDRSPTKAGGQELEQYLTFMLQGEVFAIGILHIKEIIEYGKLTTVPMMPEFIRGVINLRGAVVPVVDLGSRFGRGRSEIDRRSCIVILELQAGGDTQVIGVVVDAVNEVLEIGDESITPPPAFGANIRTDFIQGMGRLEDGFVIILDVDNILSVEDLKTIGQVGELAG
ncbi:MAG: chemotaxis protein CheW [Chromatiales bacterium]|jgi:purine-binding chemotaxis protein CheW|nr:chemotaxis protein CheW [Chromatiales bacterium]MDX9767059.1 chemotaxis protein CheW [Ectothiorhodospiraceae bacterium]